jgi:hypothetical protein
MMSTEKITEDFYVTSRKAQSRSQNPTSGTGAAATWPPPINALRTKMALVTNWKVNCKNDREKFVSRCTAVK